MNSRKQKALQMVGELSPDALDYIYEAILWAYNCTDMHDPDSLSDTDARRYDLVRLAIQESPSYVEALHKWSLAITPDWYREMRCKYRHRNDKEKDLSQ